MRVALLLTLALLVSPGAGAAAGPTDIARVDDYIDAPRALFGRTRAELERRLGAPTQERLRAGTIVLSWPGLEAAMSRVAQLVHVQPGHRSRSRLHSTTVASSQQSAVSVAMPPGAALRVPDMPTLPSWEPASASWSWSCSPPPAPPARPCPSPHRRARARP